MKVRGEMGKGKGGGGGEWESLGSTWVRHSAELKASPKVRNHRNAKNKIGYIASGEPPDPTTQMPSLVVAASL